MATDEAHRGVAVTALLAQDGAGEYRVVAALLAQVYLHLHTQEQACQSLIKYNIRGALIIFLDVKSKLLIS